MCEAVCALTFGSLLRRRNGAGVLSGDGAAMRALPIVKQYVHVFKKDSGSGCFHGSQRIGSPQRSGNT